MYFFLLCMVFTYLVSKTDLFQRRWDRDEGVPSFYSPNLHRLKPSCRQFHVDLTHGWQESTICMLAEAGSGMEPGFVSSGCDHRKWHLNCCARCLPFSFIHFFNCTWNSKRKPCKIKSSPLGFVMLFFSNVILLVVNILVNL